MIFRNSVPTSNKTQRTSTTDAKWLILRKKIIDIYSENHTKHIYIHCVGQNAELRIVKADGTYTY
jgi:hypothetical protein